MGDVLFGGARKFASLPRDMPRFEFFEKLVVYPTPGGLAQPSHLVAARLQKLVRKLAASWALRPSEQSYLNA